MPETTPQRVHLPNELGKFRRALLSSLSPDEQKAVLTRPDTPKVVSLDGNVSSGWAYLGFEHGVIYHVVQIKNETGEILGSAIEQATNPAVIVIPMRCPEDREPVFLNLSESRHYVFNLRQYPYELVTPHPTKAEFMTPPQGHARWRHNNVSSEKLPDSFSGLESITQAGLREMLEETGYVGTGRFKMLNHVFRDESLSSSQISVMIAEVSNWEKQRRFGLDSDKGEQFSASAWMSVKQLRRLRPHWRSMRSYTALGMIEDYLEGDFQDPRKRFNQIATP